jgi:hypothetical protein
MKRIFWLLPMPAVFLAALFLIAGCDEPNSPDVPLQPYHLAASYQPPSVITDLNASGSYLAAAYEFSGFDVFNVADPWHMSVVDTYRTFDAGSRCEVVGIDSVSGLAGAFFPSNNRFPLWSFIRHRRVNGINASSGNVQCLITGTVDTAVVWRTDNLGESRLAGIRFTRNIDSTWVADESFYGQEWNAPITADKVQRFDMNSSGIIAVAFEAGVALWDCAAGACIDTLYLPDHAMDCAWRGNELIVAAEYSMQIVRQESADSLRLITRFLIEGADRLNQVEVDGNYAIVLDDADGLYIVDISNVAAPVMVQKIPFLEPSALEVKGHSVFVGDRVQGLQIFTR